MSERTGKVVGVNGNMVAVGFEDRVRQNEIAYVVAGGDRLKAEVIRVKGRRADLQVFEDTRGIRLGDEVVFTDELLSVELGPGLLGQVFDGLQNPLPQLAERHGFFLKRGEYLPALPDDARWEFSPEVAVGQTVRAGMKLGVVPEKMFSHWIMVPFHLPGELEVVRIGAGGTYSLEATVAELKDAEGKIHPVRLKQIWPVKMPIRAYARKLRPETPLATKIRIIDTLVPVALGGSFCTPGPFGAGKTVLQHLISRHADVDIVVVAACGERAGEVVELLKEFPRLTDPRTGRTLMDRTVIICNTSSMPVAARESSVYTAVTIAEYYRQMGLDVLLLADSTSRWAQAMREMSGRLEEIPGEEAFPAYLETRIASFYERAGLVRLWDGGRGSVTIGGSVSPAGGNFEEPVTQATLKVVGAFHGLSRERANARRYPAIDPLESWSKYASFIPADQTALGREIVRKANHIGQMMQVVGEEGTSIGEFVDYLKGEFYDAVYLQQNAFDPVDEFCPPDRQRHVSAVMAEVLTAPLGFETRDAARRFFQELRQKWITWNAAAFQSPEFSAQETAIRNLVKTKKTERQESQTHAEDLQ